MPAAVETSGRLAAFATRAEPAWHGLGEVFADSEVVSTTTMLDKAHLSGWNVRLRELETNARAHKVQFEVIRDNPFDNMLDRLGLVGSRYTVVQNEEAFAFADGILDGGAQWETAGSILNGTVVFGSLAIDREVIVGAGEADDVTKMYLLVHTSHDGSTGVQASITPVRVVCQNTLNAALRGVKQSFKIRHTQSVEGKMTDAREALGLTFQYADAFEAEANALYREAITKNDFDAIIAQAYPVKDDASKALLTRSENRRDLLMQIWEGKADGPNTTEAIRGTKWGALNTLTESLDWYRTVRADAGAEGFLANAAGFDTVTNGERNRLLSVVKAYSAA